MHRTVSQFMRRNELEANSETLTADVTEVHALNDVRRVLGFFVISLLVYMSVLPLCRGVFTGYWRHVECASLASLLRLTAAATLCVCARARHPLLATSFTCTVCIFS